MKRKFGLLFTMVLLVVLLVVTVTACVSFDNTLLFFQEASADIYSLDYLSFDATKIVRTLTNFDRLDPPSSSDEIWEIYEYRIEYRRTSYATNVIIFLQGDDDNVLITDEAHRARVMAPFFETITRAPSEDSIFLVGGRNWFGNQILTFRTFEVIETANANVSLPFMLSDYATGTGENLLFDWENVLYVHAFGAGITRNRNTGAPVRIEIFGDTAASSITGNRQRWQGSIVADFSFIAEFAVG